MISFFIRHPTAANLLMLLIVLSGLIIGVGIKRDTFPQRDPTIVRVSVSWPGATAYEVEEGICLPLESVLEGISDLEELVCESREGSARANAKIVDGGDYNLFLQDVRDYVDGTDRFPADSERPVVRRTGMFRFIANVVLTGPDSPVVLKDLGEEIRRRFIRHDKISQVTLYGFGAREFLIEVPYPVLREFGLSLQDIANTIRQQNISASAGDIETDWGDTLLRFDERRRAAEDLGSLIVVGGESGAEVRLGDIATITDRFEKDHEASYFNRKRSAYLLVERTDYQDSLETVDALYGVIEEERRLLPQGASLDIATDRTSIVRDRLNMISKNSLLGLFLVFCLMWLFFGRSVSFWVTVGFPVSFLGTIGVMVLLGYSLNMMTLVGLLIAIGIVVDDAIVISENIMSYHQRGSTAMEAVTTGTMQAVPGVLSSFLTTVCIFVPLLFMDGVMGDILAPLIAVLLIVLSISLIEAFLILPHHLYKSLRHGKRKSDRFRLYVNSKVEKVTKFFVEKIVYRTVQWRWQTISIVIFFVLVSLSLFTGGYLKYRPFPALEGNDIEARILFPQGTSLAVTRQTVEHIISAAEAVSEELSPLQPDGESLLVSASVRYGYNAETSENGPHVATVFLRLLDVLSRTSTANQVLARWRERVGEIPDAINIVYVAGERGAAGRALEVRLYGDDLEELKDASVDLQRWLSGYKGVSDVADDLRPGKPELIIEIKSGALALGLSSDDIASQVRSAWMGQKVKEIQVGKETININVRLDKSSRDSAEDLKDFFIHLPGGGSVPLSEVADIRFHRGFARIGRVKGFRSVTVTAEIDHRLANAREVNIDMEEKFFPKLLEDYPTVRFSIEGEMRESEKTISSMAKGLILGVFAIYAVLAFQFKSWVKPILALAPIPTVFIGALWGHYLLGISFTTPSVLGLAALVGVVVNDSILLVYFVRIMEKGGLSRINAVCQASGRRLRPILLTSMTTVIGLVPMLSETDRQAQILKPLITSLAFGLSSATLLLLFLIPSLYVILDDIEGVLKRGFLFIKRRVL